MALFSAMNSSLSPWAFQPGMGTGFDSGASAGDAQLLAPALGAFTGTPPAGFGGFDAGASSGDQQLLSPAFSGMGGFDAGASSGDLSLLGPALGGFTAPMDGFNASPALMEEQQFGGSMPFTEPAMSPLLASFQSPFGFGY